MCVPNEKFFVHQDEVKGMAPEDRAVYLQGLVAALSGMVSEETWDAAKEIAERPPRIEDLFDDKEGMEHGEEEIGVAVGAC